jgi:cell division protein FtsL
MRETNDNTSATEASRLSGADARAAADAAREARRTSTRRTQRAARVREGRVAPDRASEKHPAEERREASSERTININGFFSVIGDFVIRFRFPLLVAVVVIGLLVSMYGPLQSYYQAWRAGDALRAQLEEYNQSNEEARNDISALQTEEGIKDVARKRGYVEEGETKVVVEGLDDGSDSDSSSGSDGSSDSGSSSSEDPWYIQFGDKFFNYVPAN